MTANGWPQPLRPERHPAEQATADTTDRSLDLREPAHVGKVVVVGQGYVGLPLAMRSVEVGYTVVGVDVDETRVKRLCIGESYVEDVPATRLAAAVETGRYVASTSYRLTAGFDVAVVTVPTPLREGNPDLSYIEAAGRCLGRYLRPGATVVLESTTYPGTTEELLAPILEEASGLVAGSDFHLGYSPERIDPGNPTWNLVNTPKVVSGVTPESLAAVRRFYDSMVDVTIPVSSCKEAELTKLLENTFRHVNIALINELAMFAHDLGIDIWEAIDAASTKPFGYLRFTPGPGVGGHCLPIDPSYLSWRVKRRTGRSFRFVELANDVNDHMPEYVVQRVIDALNRRRKAVNGSTIVLLGLAYKRNTGDARESPGVRVADLLMRLGADVRAIDPYVSEPVHSSLVNAEGSDEELVNADAVILLTDHDVFRQHPLPRTNGVLLDCRRVLPDAELL